MEQAEQNKVMNEYEYEYEGDFESDQEGDMWADEDMVGNPFPKIACTNAAEGSHRTGPSPGCQEAASSHEPARPMETYLEGETNGRKIPR